MKKLAIFDFDGTLFDSVGDVVECFNETLTQYNFPLLTRDEYIECLGGNIDEAVSLILNENNTSENIDKVKKTYLELYDNSEKENTIPFPKTLDCLKKLQEKGILLAINSNRQTYSLKYFIEMYFSEIDFVLIEGHNADYPSKPSPIGVKKIIEKAKVTLDEVIYIGDSKTDIRTAKNAGIDCIIVTWGYGNQDDYNDEYILNTIDQVSQIINYF